MLLGGQYNGQVAIFDPRKGTRPVEVSPIEKSHRDPVFSVKFLASKQGTDAFSCSSDGQVLFWDVRKLAEPVETLMIDPMQDGKLLGGVALEYESTMPTKFQVGTEQGEVILFNRKGKTPSEKIAASYVFAQSHLVFVAIYHRCGPRHHHRCLGTICLLPHAFCAWRFRYPCHLGPVYAVERNPFFPKYFLTVGDWSMRTWCEDIKESSVMWTKFYDCNLTSGAWSTSRPSVCFSTKADGSLDIWDILFKSSVPTLTVQVTDVSIQSIRVDSRGK
jgi:dynein intermediate chain 2